MYVDFYFNAHEWGRYEYLIIFIDDYSKFRYLPNALDKFIEIKVE